MDSGRNAIVVHLNRDKLIGQGNTAEIYSVDEEKILKLFRNGLHEGIVEREYQNSVLVGKILSCVPAVYDKVEVEGRTGIVYERICGKSLLQMMMGSLRKMKEGSKNWHNTIWHYKDLLTEILSQ